MHIIWEVGDNDQPISANIWDLWKGLALGAVWVWLVDFILVCGLFPELEGASSSSPAVWWRRWRWWPGLAELRRNSGLNSQHYSGVCVVLGGRLSPVKQCRPPEAAVLKISTGRTRRSPRPFTSLLTCWLTATAALVWRTELKPQAPISLHITSL